MTDVSAGLFLHFFVQKKKKRLSVFFFFLIFLKDLINLFCMRIEDLIDIGALCMEILSLRLILL